ncbi:ATP-binding response regulator [Candidatus Magnetomonas plexicatena]|uniref:ATP-binding response regulator n=1 Tax=Candidatus Magnetomonas plexicatena TaxID=2552947 RepID=UPI004032CBB3
MSQEHITRVLLVEDDEEDIYYLKEILSETDTTLFELCFAKSLKAAIDALQEDSFDVILLDLFLSDSEGIDTFKLLRLNAKKKPIIILSALDDENLAIRAIKEGAQDYIFKWKVNGEVLVRTIKYSIERNRLLVEIEQAAENRFFKIIEKNADAIVIVDRSGFILFVNPALEEMFERACEDLIGELFGFPMVAGETVEIDIVNRAGTMKIAEMRMVEFPWEGETVYLASLRDVTERKKTEQLLFQSEKMVSIGRLASGVAHEINNPLSNVLLITHTLKNRLQSSNTDDYIVKKLDLLKKNIERATAITKELLTFSRQSPTNMIYADINDIIESSLTLVSSKLKGIEITKKLSDVPGIRCDYMRLEQVFINIFNNAAEAMTYGGQLNITTKQSDGFVEVMVTDTGIGISDEHMKNIFDPFYTTKESGTSIGMGLYICYSIVREHDGSIVITSPKNTGVVVTIKFPQAEVHE